VTGYFITGTDTGVGKTVLCASLLSALRAAGINAAPMKPVQTGCADDRGSLSAPDLEFCLKMAEMDVEASARERMSPYRYLPACSPHLAAERAGQTISIDRIARCFEEVSRQYTCVLVEGAGGVMVPISRDRTMLDLMTRLGLPVLVAARPGLGTLNHTLLTLEALGHRGLELGGIVLVYTDPEEPAYIAIDNAKTLTARCGARCVTSFPYTDLDNTDSELRNTLRRTGERLISDLHLPVDKLSATCE